MPSSIFGSDSSSDSSSGDPRASAWIRSWSVALLLLVGCVLVWEMTWRGAGFEPSVNDDAALWALARERAASLGLEGVVLVGSSRMQMAIHREVFADVTGWEPPVQLAVVRGPSLPVLRSLAEDPGFRGTVLCEINPVLFFARTALADRMIDEYVEAFADSSFADRIEQRLRMKLQQVFVSRLPGLSPAAFAKRLRARDLPVPGYNDVITANRFRYGDYGKHPDLASANRVNAREIDRARPVLFQPGRWAERVARVGSWVDRIRSRGGQVVFIRLPTTIFVGDFEQRRFPRAEFWDRFAAGIDAPAIHFEDHPRLAGLEPPDGEHLGREQAMRFSWNLGTILVELGVAPGPSSRSASAPH